MDRETKKIIGFHLGGRGREDALKFWQSLPPVYRQCAIIYSDLWKAYSGFCQANDIEQSVKKVEKQIILKDLIIL